MTENAKPTTVTITLYDEVDDVAVVGPGMIFAAANAVSGQKLFRVFSVGAKQQEVRTIGGSTLRCDYVVPDAPMADILILPGAAGTTAPLTVEPFMSWLESAVRACDLVLTLCSGIRLLAAVKGTEGLTATTHPDGMEIMQEAAPGATIIEDRVVWVNDGVIAGSGLNGGLEAALEVVRRFHGLELAQQAARRIEYEPLELG